MSELQKADPRARRKAVIVVVIMMIIGSVLIFAADSQLDRIRDWLTEDPSQTYFRFRALAAVLSIALALPMLWFTVYLWRMGGRIRQAAQFPPPGTRVVRDTVILHGAQAQRRGLLLQGLSVLLMLSTAAFIAAFWLLAEILRR